MALNLQTLKTRALTAVIFVALMLFGLLYSYWSFFILFSIIHFGCWFEYQKIVGLIDESYSKISKFHKYIVMVCGFGFMLWNINKHFAIKGIHYNVIGQWIVIACFISLPVIEMIFSKKNNLKVVAHSFFGLAYISLSWGLMISLRSKGVVFKGTSTVFDFGYTLPIILIASIWINDTMAYIVGSLIGRTPLSKISPKKTWEGTIGGAVLAIVVVTVLCYNLIGSHTLLISIVTSTIAAFVGTLGDLLESKLKRLANVKDSGSIMPGHGGFLDRFDSLLLATPFVWFFLKLL